MSAPGQLIDPACLYAAAGDDAAVVAELLALFAHSYPLQLAALRAAARADSAAAVATRAHTLRGSLLAVGANASATHMATLERAARVGGMAGAGAVLDDAMFAQLEQVSMEAAEHAAAARAADAGAGAGAAGVA